MSKTVAIALTRGYEAIVDAADKDLVASMKWRVAISGNGIPYACRSTPRGERQRNGGRERVFMHRPILAAPDDMEVDHINGDSLDNRRANLRLATRRENGANLRTPRSNTSGFKGVSWHGATNSWRAYIRIDYRQVHLGHFANALSAAIAYDAAAIEAFGPFARLNFPRGLR